MATAPVITGAPTRAPTNDWIEHDGKGRPVPVGTLVQVRMFNGDVLTIAAGTGTFDLDGSPIPAWRSAGWSAWDHADGGPMAPKFRAYRLACTGTSVAATSPCSDRGSTCARSSMRRAADMAGPSSTRRGLLGWLAAAPVAAVAVKAAAQVQPEQDWQTKPIEQFTKYDFLAEAQYHVDRISERLRADPRNRYAAASLGWWEKQLAIIKHNIATARPMREIA